MKNILIVLILFTCLGCKKDTSKTDISQAVVQDYSSFFSEEEKEKLATKIISFEEETTNQICIYTLDSIPNNEDALIYATQIANKLGVGTKEKDNGLFILLSKYDRNISIATGYGTEKIITDSIATVIIEQTIIPKFKESRYYEGINVALDSIFLKWN